MSVLFDDASLIALFIISDIDEFELFERYFKSKKLSLVIEIVVSINILVLLLTILRKPLF